MKIDKTYFPLIMFNVIELIEETRLLPMKSDLQINPALWDIA